MKTTTLPLAAAILVGSTFVAPSAEAQKTVRIYRQDLKAALEGTRNKQAIRVAGKVFKRAVKKQLTQKAPKLIQIANNMLATLIKNPQQRVRAQNFTKTLTSKLVFRGLLQKRLNQAIIKTLQRIPTGKQSERVLAYTQRRLFKAFKKGRRRTPAQYNKIMRNAARILKQPAPPPVSTF